MRVALARHDALVRAALETHGGRVFKTIGDQFCAAFATASEALDAALAVQAQVRSVPASSVAAAARLSVEVRTALHTGEAEIRDGDYFGPVLNRLARLLAVGHGGQVLVSHTTYEL